MYINKQVKKKSVYFVTHKQTQSGGGGSLALLFLSSFSKENPNKNIFSGLFIIQCHLELLSVAIDYTIPYW